MKPWSEYESKLPFPSRRDPDYEERRREVRADDDRLVKVFYEDARAELAYGSLLTASGCEVVEKMAWSNGHSAGFGDIHYQLRDLSDLVEELAKPGVWKKGEKA